MNNIALIEAKPSRNNYSEFNFEFDRFALCSNPDIKKVLKKDVDLEFDPDAYEWVILIGSEPLKYFTKVTQVMQYAGTVVDDKYLPTINPSMLAFKPEAKQIWTDSVKNITDYVSGARKKVQFSEDQLKGIEDTKVALAYIQKCIDSSSSYFAIDSETTALYPRNGHILGLSLSWIEGYGCYINADCIDETVEAKLQELFNKKRAVFHNAKFDIAFLEYHLNVQVKEFDDTMLMHYIIDERPGTHGLKLLAMQYTDYGDYEKPLYDWIDDYRKKYKILKDDFKWEWIPFEVMVPYAATDAIVTFILYEKMRRALESGNQNLTNAYKNILIPACRFLIDVQNTGVPFNRERLIKSQELMAKEIHEAVEKLSKHEAIGKFESEEGKVFNPNSVIQLRKLLFDYIGLEPTGIKTEKGENSTNSEVLEKLSIIHEIPRLILDIRKKSKLKNTYLDKIIPQLDRDSRLRTNFNLHTVTSGRLSSSGKLNMQQLPRDTAIIKGCIMARDGYRIVAMDLTTAEVYVAAVLSNDLELQEVFKSGGNFHSTIAHKVFQLDCPIEEVAIKYPQWRQAAKAVTFGIMYGAGPTKISYQVTKDGGNLSVLQAKRVIKDYFNTFWKLEEWIEERKAEIMRNGRIYSHFGRRRRLDEVKSDNKGIQSHAVRSGLNFLVQSVASDINLLGAIEAHNELKQKNIDAQIFALVHDSVLAEVREDLVEKYSDILKKSIQKDRGVSIPGCPIGCDFQVGKDYSMGKYEECYLN